jgi:hypothetical protein
MIPPSRNQVGRLEFLCLAGSLCLAVGSFWDLWPFNLPIALLLLAVVYGVLRDLRSFNRSETPVKHLHRSREAHAEQADRASR